MSTILSLMFVLTFTEGTAIVDYNTGPIPWNIPPHELLGDGQLSTYLNDYGQITADGHILLATEYEILDYDLDGNFHLKIELDPSKKYIACQTYDPVHNQYVISTVAKEQIEGAPVYFLDFYDSDGKLVNKAPVVFEYQNQPRTVIQIRYLNENRFLVNFWSEKMATLKQPGTLVIAERRGTAENPVLVPVSNAFDAQWGSRRRQNDNFKDRWGVFYEDEGVCLVAQTLARDLQSYSLETFAKRNDGDALGVTFKTREPKLDLDLWQSHEMYPTEMAEQLKAGVRSITTAMAWSNYMSRIRGFYGLDNQLLVLGYSSPNPYHAFYRKSQFWPNQHLELKRATSPFVLTLRTLVFDPLSDDHPQLTPDEIRIPGGVLLGTYQNNAYVLVETQFDTKQGFTFDYSLHKLAFYRY